MLAGDLVSVGVAALSEGEPALARFALQLFRPLQPMLADSAEDVPAALAELGRAAFEHKLDGARVQVHKAAGEVRVFTRLLNDVTHACPELVEVVSALPARELVLDGEAIALRSDGRPHPFQVTMRRFGRKLDVAALRAELPLSVSFFDLLHEDGETLLDHPAERALRAPRARAARALSSRASSPPTSPRPSASSRTRSPRHEGSMAKALDRALRGRPARQGVAEAQAGAHARSRRARRRVGQRPAQGWLSNLHLGARDEPAAS
jgi:DNA ligase-1